MAYVVSHDLAKPLGQFARFLEMLEQDAGQRLGRDSRALLDQARRSAGRLESMVDAGLRCARVESRGEAFVAVELDALLERVLARLAEEIRATGAEVVRSPLPAVRGDESQLEQLFQNLLDNAVKFRAARRRASRSRPPTRASSGTSSSATTASASRPRTGNACS